MLGSRQYEPDSETVEDPKHSSLYMTSQELIAETFQTAIGYYLEEDQPTD